MSIRDCRFIGIEGLFGAAIMMSESSATTNGNNTFADCAASAGGSVYLFNSKLTLNGTNVFLNNRVAVHMEVLFFGWLETRYVSCNHGTVNYDPTEIFYYMDKAHGGAILCSNCTLQINEYSRFKSNYADSGGAVAGLHGRISIHDSTLFDGNSADVGGAMNLEDINLTISGNNISLANNSAAYGGGALHISDTNISFNMDITSKVSEILVDESSFMVVFRQNKASQVGGAIVSHANNVLIFTGTVKFIENSALNGGAIGFLQSFPQSRIVLVPVLNISFIMNHANESGGALYFKDSQCILESNSPECFISIVNRSSYPNPILIFEHNSAGSVGSSYCIWRTSQ